jgi:hypothetical protein
MVSAEEVALEIQHGAKFVVYEYCFSIVILTFRRSSNIYYIRPRESSLGKGWIYTLISLLFGWWGIPWGPIYTVATIVNNLRGGLDITQDIVAAAGPQGVEVSP